MYTKVAASKLVSALGGLKLLTRIVKTTDDYIQCANQTKIQMSIGKQQLTLDQ